MNETRITRLPILALDLWRKASCLFMTCFIRVMNNSYFTPLHLHIYCPMNLLTFSSWLGCDKERQKKTKQTNKIFGIFSLFLFEISLKPKTPKYSWVIFLPNLSASNCLSIFLEFHLAKVFVYLDEIWPWNVYFLNTQRKVSHSGHVEKIWKKPPWQWEDMLLGWTKKINQQNLNQFDNW